MVGMLRDSWQWSLQYLSKKLSSKLMPRKFPYTTLPVVTAFWGSGTSNAWDVWRAEKEETRRRDLKREWAKTIFANAVAETERGGGGERGPTS